MPDSSGSQLKRRMPVPGEGEKPVPAAGKPAAKAPAEKKVNHPRNIAIILGSVLIILMVAAFVLGPRNHSDGAPLTDTPESSPSSDTLVVEESVDGNQIVSCLICRKTVKASDAEFQHRIPEADTTYYFDTEECYKKFLDHPDRFMEPSVRYKVNVKVVPKPSEVPDPTGVSTDTPFIQDVPMDAPTPEMVPDTSPGESGGSTEPPVDVDSGSSGDSSPAAPPKGGPKAGSGPDIEIPDGALPPGKGPDLKTTPIGPPPGGKSHTY